MQGHPLPRGHIATVMHGGQAMAVEIIEPVHGRACCYRVRVPADKRHLWDYRDPIWLIKDAGEMTGQHAGRSSDGRCES